MKILVTGGQGQLGQALANHPDARAYELILASHATLDITHLETTDRVIQTVAPDIVINAAAYTAVDQAETDQEMAYAVNCLGAKHIAHVCHQHSIPLIHLSTDYLFDGTKRSPYREDDPAKPINHYGKTKWLGEEMIRKHSAGHLILRICGLFGEYGNNFYKTIMRLHKEGQPLRVVNDQITCPTYTHDIADTLLKIIQKDRYDGTYHFCSMPPVSWHAFAEAAVGESIEAITSDQMQRPAKRPAHSVFDCSKISAIFGITPPSWQHALEQLR